MHLEKVPSGRRFPSEAILYFGLCLRDLKSSSFRDVLRFFVFSISYFRTFLFPNFFKKNLKVRWSNTTCDLKPLGKKSHLPKWLQITGAIRPMLWKIEISKSWRKSYLGEFGLASGGKLEKTSFQFRIEHNQTKSWEGIITQIARFWVLY